MHVRLCVGVHSCTYMCLSVIVRVLVGVCVCVCVCVCTRMRACVHLY